MFKSAYPPFKFCSNQSQWKENSDNHYLKLSYICNLSHHLKNKLSSKEKSLVKKILTLRQILIHSKLKNYFSNKDPIPNDSKSLLVYTFTCASCSSNYIGETCRHFKTRIEEHIKKDNKSHIFKHLHSTATCFDSYNSLCFKIIDKANSKFDLKIGELKCTSKSFYYRFCAPLFFSVFVVLGFLGVFCFIFVSVFVLFCFVFAFHCIFYFHYF